tara:strand:- start:1187 stop:1678 length:492 start_codon:yes stop_codon:yes gene_type:complete
MNKKIINTLLFLLIQFIYSCTTTEKLDTKKKIYVGMSKEEFCDVTVFTSLSNDPCMKNSQYFQDSNLELLNSNTQFFLFDNVTQPSQGKRGIIKNLNGDGYLVSIHKSYSEAMDSKFAKEYKENTTSATGETIEESKEIEKNYESENEKINIEELIDSNILKK